MRVPGGPLLLLLFCAQAAPLLPQGNPLRGLGVDEHISDDAIAGSALGAPELQDLTYPLFVRLLVPRSAIETAPSVHTFEQLDRRLNLYSGSGTKVLLTFLDVPIGPEEVESWRSLMQTLAERYRGRVLGYVLGDASEDGVPPNARDYAYVLKLTAVQIRSADPEALIIEGHVPEDGGDWLESLYAEGIAPYVDAISVSIGASPEQALRARLESLSRVLAELDPAAGLLASGAPLDGDPGEAGRTLLLGKLLSLATGATLITYQGSPEVLAAGLAAARGLGDLWSHGVASTDRGTASLRFEMDGQEQTESIPHELFYDLETATQYVAYWADPDTTYASDEVRLELLAFTPDAPVLHDAVSGSQWTLAGFDWDEQTMLFQATVPLRDRPLIVEFSSASEATSVTAAAGLSVEAIVARHQQTQAAQVNRLVNYSAALRMEVHFQPSATDPGYDVMTENHFYLDRDGSEWEELSFRINGSQWGSDRPAFPLLQPEKVLSLPLELQFNTDYSYRLKGREAVGERDCYVLQFEPIHDDRSLYRGRVWIDVETFAKLRVEAVQTGLTPPLASNEETHWYRPIPPGDPHPLYLLSRLSSRQLFLIAGRNILVEKESYFSDFRVNAPDFAERRDSARAGEHIMFRDTDEGLRHFVKRGGIRVVSEELTKTATAFALGGTFDPAFDIPVPILGVSHLDFDFLKRDMQLSLLFGGVVVFGNLQKIALFGTPLDMSIDFSGIAIRQNDQVFAPEGEIEDEDLLTRTFSTGLNVGWQFSDFQKISASYLFNFQDYAEAETTSPDFVVPQSTPTNGLGISYEYGRNGFMFGGSASYSRRSDWEPWGHLSSFDPATRSYVKYEATLARNFFLGAFQKLHFDVGYYDGKRLDRFTKYQAGFFDNTRIHGVPSGAVRFDRLFLLRGVYTVDFFGQYRFDAFIDQAFGRDRADLTNSRAITGIGFGLNLRGPWRTLIRGEIGKSFLPDRYRGAGSVVAQILILKPL